MLKFYVSRYLFLLKFKIKRLINYLLARLFFRTFFSLETQLLGEQGFFQISCAMPPLLKRM